MAPHSKLLALFLNLPVWLLWLKAKFFEQALPLLIPARLVMAADCAGEVFGERDSVGEIAEVVRVIVFETSSTPVP